MAGTWCWRGCDWTLPKAAWDAMKWPGDGSPSRAARNCIHQLRHNDWQIVIYITIFKEHAGGVRHVLFDTGNRGHATKRGSMDGCGARRCGRSGFSRICYPSACNPRVTSILRGARNACVLAAFGIWAGLCRSGNATRRGVPCPANRGVPMTF